MTSNLEDHIERLAIMAAVLEVSASPKPGNVHRYKDFSDTNYEHFLGAAIGAGPIWRMTAKRGIMASLDEIESCQSIVQSSHYFPPLSNRVKWPVE